MYLLRKAKNFYYIFISKAEMARLRLQAGCCIIKLVQEPCYNELVTQDQFQTVALLLNVSSVDSVDIL